MNKRAEPLVRGGLLTRRTRLEHYLGASPTDQRIKLLLRQVDDALARLEGDTYGLCEVCHEPIETDRLIANPLVSFCLDHLTPSQQRALESDIEVASRIQNGLLPPRGLQAVGWQTDYHYQGASIVSGDYCDLFTDDRGLHFVVGDVSGKGVSAAMLMAHLHATYRALVPQALPLGEIVERASSIFCDSTLPTHYATLVCGQATATGEIELCIAGHAPALVVHGTGVERVESTGLPLGMFSDERFTVHKSHMSSQESIVLYTDGLNESLDPEGSEYGIERLADLLATCGSRSPREIIQICLADLESFRRGADRLDDLTIMVLRRA
jgi:phosphoserine phosphatase RsbU/P